MVFLDSDDRMKPRHLERLRTLTEEHPEANFLATRLELISDGRRRRSDLAEVPSGFYGVELFLDGNPLGCNVCVRRTNPRLHRFRETPVYQSEDWIFLLQNLMEDRLYLDDAVTILMNDHEGRTMRGDPVVLLEAKVAAVDWIERHLALSAGQMARVRGHAGRFQALHAHLAGRRLAALRLLAGSIRAAGLKRSDLRLLLRIILGPSLAARLQGGLR